MAEFMTNPAGHFNQIIAAAQAVLRDVLVTTSRNAKIISSGRRREWIGRA
jgi:hypothetical protein